ncbi:NifU family protein [Candidatus Peregrinibacteria bacterium]|nr:NifU family protein [Candidatus Peregrinibacteria bacterium]
MKRATKLSTLKKPTTPLLKKLQKFFDKKIRPILQTDNGDIEIISLKGKILTVRLIGVCGSCPYGLMTLQYGVQANINEAFPKEKIVVQLASCYNKPRGTIKK